MSKVNHYSASECLENYLKRLRLERAVLEAAKAERLADLAMEQYQHPDPRTVASGDVSRQLAIDWDNAVNHTERCTDALLAFEAAQEAKP